MDDPKAIGILRHLLAGERFEAVHLLASLSKDELVEMWAACHWLSSQTRGMLMAAVPLERLLPGEARGEGDGQAAPH